MVRKVLMVLGLVVIAPVLGMLSVAWACTGQPQVFSVNPLTAPAGAEVSLRGQGVATGMAVELRWNGVAGPKLAEVTAVDSGFVLDFTVPDVSPGVYSLVVVAADDVAGVGRATFEVSGAGQGGFGDGEPSGFAATAEDGAMGLGSQSGAGSSATLLAGVGLLAFGGMALASGFAVATVRRHRVLAEPRG